MIEKVLETLDEVKNFEKKGPNIEISYKPEDLKLNYDSVYKEKAIEGIQTRNGYLEGEKHPETGVPFERKEVETTEGKKEGVFPQFNSVFDVKLPEDLEQATDREQFKHCNEQLKEELEKSSEIKKEFTSEQLEQIEENETPDGYTWHHSEETGKMQLVDSETHAKTGHTGGKSIWGGGSENR
jgi:hypothetical protein